MSACLLKSFGKIDGEDGGVEDSWSLLEASVAVPAPSEDVIAWESKAVLPEAVVVVVRGW